jgi:hypothetical protein
MQDKPSTVIGMGNGQQWWCDMAVSVEMLAID